MVCLCSTGVRAAQYEELIQIGFRDIYPLEGAIEAWSRNVNPEVPRY